MTWRPLSNGLRRGVMVRLVNEASALVSAALRLTIRAYQTVISPLTPASCRYWPSCSEYAVQAITLHGPIGGGWLALKRLVRCHPWGGWGYDPVPNRAEASSCSHHHTEQGRGNRPKIAPVSGVPS